MDLGWRLSTLAWGASILLAVSGCGDTGATATADDSAAQGNADSGDTALPEPADTVTDSAGGGSEVIPLDSGATTDASTAADSAGSDSTGGCTGAGCPCTANGQCESGQCIEVDNAKVCAQLCTSECPAGQQCVQVGGSGADILNICVPSHPRLCEPCYADTDCSNVLGGSGSRCVPYTAANGSLIGRFCATPCSNGGGCPLGYGCQDSTSVSGIKAKVCVAEQLACSCSARAAELGLNTDCSLASAEGTCGGKRTCSAGGLSACDAPQAASETCNQVDDDCDGKTDEPSPGVCNDGEGCTIDICLDGTCAHSPKAGACDDGSACTSGEACVNGVCSGTTVNCDDGKPCTSDGCDPKSGCTHSYADGMPCDDGNACSTADLCGGGLCLPGPATACDDGNFCTTDSCNTSSGCVFTANTLPCTDGDICTAGDACAGGGCVPGKPLPCKDGNVCTDDGCDVVAGCTFVDNAVPCSDGNVCTQGDTCSSGSCVSGAQQDCDDGKVCTFDACDAQKGCLFKPLKALCDDGDACTLIDQCKDGSCVAGEPAPCDDGNTCTDDSCLAASGCQHATNNGPCSDGNACSVLDQCNEGKCVAGNEIGCDDGDVCTTDTCVPQMGCLNMGNTAPCSDNNACTMGDTCKGGLCVPGSPLPCNDENPCTDDSCHPFLGCLYAANSSACSDGNACTTGDVCGSGKCQPGAVVNCEDGNPCTDDTCSPVAGCVKANNSNACDDGQGCTSGDACSGGQCKGGAGCDANAACSGNGPTAQCTCKSGYSGSGFACSDIDECASGKSNCPLNTVCANTIGSYTCTCSQGFVDCDNNLANGCEANPLTDAKHCGGCGKVCSALQACANGVCVSTTGQIVYAQVGTFEWTVPAGVTAISAVAVGAGGGGGGGTDGANGGRGGGGGALVWGNNIAVTPGEKLTIVVGGGGAQGAGNVAGKPGDLSEIRRGNTVLMRAAGGLGGGAMAGPGAAGGAASLNMFPGNQGGGNGGGSGNAGGCGGSGGGGAGGYTAAGGGGGVECGTGSGGSGGGGGGGDGSNSFTAGGGGGVGLLGSGNSGGTQVAGNPSDGASGGGGSGGQNGNAGQGSPPGKGGAYGGGGGGANDAAGATGGAGANGAVRILWGGGRSYPVNAQDL